MNNSNDDQEDKVFKVIQKFLKDPPVIIWGSGATIPYGLPSMDDLKKSLQSQNIVSLKENKNLEVELGEIQDTEKINKIRAFIRSKIFKKDIECLKQAIEDINYFSAVNKMIEKFCEAHPQKINIITTNYDRVLEYAISKLGYNYTDGFTGKQLSQFDQDNFKTKNIINLKKVHGSLNWSSLDDSEPFFLTHDYENNKLNPLMVLPAKNKFQDTHKEPYRTIITKSDEAINKAKSFLVVGFGFNDEHITPKLDDRIRKNIPIVVITKKATDSCLKKLQNAKNYCLLEEGENQPTKVTSSDQTLDEYSPINLSESYWQLENFMRIFYE